MGIINQIDMDKIQLVMKADERLKELDKSITESMDKLIELLADHVTRSATIIVEQSPTEINSEDLDSLKFDMVTVLVSSLPHKFGPDIIDRVLPNGWAEVAAKNILAELTDIIKEHEESEQIPDTIH